MPGRELFVIAAVVALTLGHSVVDLPRNPPLSYDEGYILQAPRNLVADGFYGTRGVEGEIPFDPHITTGPPVTLPIALSFALFGEGVLQARGVVVAYAALTVAAFFVLMRSAFALPAAALAAILLSFSLYPYNRTALGEVPALFWLFAGAWAWIRGLASAQPRAWFVAAGLAFGLAALTKLTIAPLVAVSLVAAWAMASRRRPVTLIVPSLTAVGIVLLWWAYQAFSIGGSGIVRSLSELAGYREQLAGGTEIFTNLGRLGEAIPPGLLLWLLPAIAYAILRLVRRSDEPVLPVFLVALTLSGMAFYLTSIGWGRYGFWGMAAATGLVALFVSELTGPGRRPRATAFVALAVLAYPAVWTANRLSAGDDSPTTIVQFLREQMGDDDVLATAEWELDFLAKRTFKHPPAYVATEKATASGLNRTLEGVDWAVVGPIGRSLGVGPMLASNPSFVERHAVGSYRVFQRSKDMITGWRWSTSGATPTPAFSTGVPVGQSFIAGHDLIREVRVLLAGEGSTQNASVRLRLLETPGGTLIAEDEAPAHRIVENRWYRFRLDAEVVRGRRYYVELISQPKPGQRAPAAWYNNSVDNYPQGRWYLAGLPQEGDLYFGVIGQHRSRRPLVQQAGEADPQP